MKHKFFQLTNKSFEELGVSNYQQAWEKVKAEGYTALQAGFVTSFTKSEDSENKFHAVLSDSLEDRHGDIVVQEWVLTNFKKNPVLLDSHDYWSIEKIIGKWAKIAVKDGKLQGEIEFAVSNPLGLIAYNLAKDGFLNALSAGFIPLEFGEKGEIKKSELLEGSMVSVPANPRTLIEKGMHKKSASEGEACEMPDGSMGEMHPNGDGEMVCMKPKKGLDVVQTPATNEIPAEATVVKRSVFVALNEKLKKQDAILRSVAKELSGVNESNVEARKRQLWKALRGAL